MTRNSIPAAYFEHDAIFRECPFCGAQVEQLCINPISGRASNIPHVVRLKEGLTWP